MPSVDVVSLEIFYCLVAGESAVDGDVGQQNEKLCNFTKKALHIQLDR